MWYSAILVQTVCSVTCCASRTYCELYSYYPTVYGVLARLNVSLNVILLSRPRTTELEYTRTHMLAHLSVKGCVHLFTWLHLCTWLTFVTVRFLSNTHQLAHHQSSGLQCVPCRECCTHMVESFLFFSDFSKQLTFRSSSVWLVGNLW